RRLEMFTLAHMCPDTATRTQAKRANKPLLEVRHSSLRRVSMVQLLGFSINLRLSHSRTVLLSKRAPCEAGADRLLGSRPLSKNHGGPAAALLMLRIADRAVAEDAGCDASPQSAQSEGRSATVRTLLRSDAKLGCS